MYLVSKLNLSIEFSVLILLRTHLQHLQHWKCSVLFRKRSYEDSFDWVGLYALQVWLYFPFSKSLTFFFGIFGGSIPIVKRNADTSHNISKWSLERILCDITKLHWDVWYKQHYSWTHCKGQITNLLEHFSKSGTKRQQVIQAAEVIPRRTWKSMGLRLVASYHTPGMIPRSRRVVPAPGQYTVIIQPNSKKLHLSKPPKLQSYLCPSRTGQEAGITMQRKLREADTPNLP